MTRREAREHVFRILFAYDFYAKDKAGKKEPDEAAEENRPEPVTLDEQIELYFTHEGGDELDFPPCEVPEAERPAIAERAAKVVEKLPQIDAEIDRISTGWKTARMARADLAILRLAVYEMFYDDQIPVGVAINEAVILAKKFGGDDSRSFINGILAKMNRLKESSKE